MLKSEFDEIKGIGSKTKDLLLEKFKSLEKIKTLDPEQLETLIGKSKANILISVLTKVKA